MGSWMKDGRHTSQEEYQLSLNMAPQKLTEALHCPVGLMQGGGKLIRSSPFPVEDFFK